MKLRTLSLILALLLCSVALFACQSGTNTETLAPEDGSNAEAPVESEVFDAGNFSVDVAKGWKAFPSKDLFSDEENAMDPDRCSVCKGGETELDLFSKPYIQFDYYGPDREMMRPTKDLYDKAEDLEPITAGETTWEGFVAESAGTKVAILFYETDEGTHQYQACFWFGSNGDEISFTDADVLEILSSVRPSAK